MVKKKAKTKREEQQEDKIKKDNLTFKFYDRISLIPSPSLRIFSATESSSLEKKKEKSKLFSL